MRRFTMVALGLVLAGCAAPPTSSVTATALQKNAKRLSAGELKALYANSVVEGTTRNGVDFQLRTRENGRYDGTTAQGGFTGRWSVNERNEVCFHTDGIATATPCMQQYVLDGKYYGVTPDGYVLERTVKPVAQADSEKK